VNGVAGELRQAISNLVANAIDAVESGGGIAVSVHPLASDKNGFVEVIVADEGPGIAAEHIGHLFEPFFTTKKDVGTGLGLWAAKNIVERHGGTISVSSGRNGDAVHGATFTIRLPYAASADGSGSKV
jgi:signal transduction histidine kinase